MRPKSSKISEDRVLTDNAVPVGLELLLKLVFHKLSNLLLVEHNIQGVGSLFGREQSHVILHELHVDLRFPKGHI